MARDMKDSGIHEIGLIPDNWLRHVKVGFYFYFKSGDTLTSLEIENIGQYTVYGANGLRGFYSKYNTIGCHILLGRVGALCGNVHLIGGKNWVTEHSLICSPKKECNQNYFAYLFEIMNLGKFSKASAQPVISVDTVSHLFFVVPPINEQRNIVGFLNYKCSEIDSLVADITKEIELLKEYRKSVIYEAVTKGLDPNVEMKDSGIEWVGSMPKSWTTVCISYCTTSRSGATPDRLNMDYWEEGVIPWMASGEVNKIFVYETNEKISLKAVNETSAKILPANSVMVALNGQGKTKGMSAIIKIPSACNQSLCAFQCYEKKLHYRYLFYSFQTMYKYLRSQSGDNLRDGLSASFVRKQRIPLPDLNSQNKIADILDLKCSQIDSLISDKQQQIDKLTEYKKSLIYEYVTGKKEVPAV